MVNLPNFITIIRILLVPAFLYFFWEPVPHRVVTAMLILAVAGGTDILDGYLARRFNMITPLGKILDPLADKLMLITAMLSLYLIDRFPLWLVILVVAKELVLIVGSFFLVLRSRADISANIYGKAATLLIYMALFTQAFNISGSDIISWAAGVVSVVALYKYVGGVVRKDQY